jgi:hypothetical protein
MKVLPDYNALRRAALNAMAFDVCCVYLHKIEGAHCRADSRGNEVVHIGRWMDGDAAPENPLDPNTVILRTRS